MAEQRAEAAVADQQRQVTQRGHATGSGESCAGRQGSSVDQRVPPRRRQSSPATRHYQHFQAGVDAEPVQTVQLARPFFGRRLGSCQRRCGGGSSVFDFSGAETPAADLLVDAEGRRQSDSVVLSCGNVSGGRRAADGAVTGTERPVRLAGNTAASARASAARTTRVLRSPGAATRQSLASWRSAV